MTKKMCDLQEIVVYDCYCLWDLFLENVRDSGWTMARLEAEAERCEGEKALRKLVNRFI